LILVIGFATIVSLIRLENALDYYQTIGNDELQALRWIKANTTANAIFATSGVNGTFSEDSMPGNTYSWWIEGFSERKSYHSGLTKLYTYEDERLTTERINRIFAGTYGFEFNNLRVSESFPFPISNPEISAFVNGQYRNIIFLSDGTEELVFSPIETDQIVWHESPFYAENKTVAFNSNETWANATYTYEWSHLKVVKNVVVSSQDSSVDIAFHILPKNSKLKQFRTSLWTSYFNLLEDYSINNSTILLRQRLPSNAVVETELSLLETNGEINGTDVFFKDPKYSMPAATYSLTPLQDELYARFRITIISDNSGESKQSLELYNSNDLITELRINYFFINKGRINEYYRFLNDNNHFAVAFENEKIAIFRVL
jgi:hypothetical protein